MITTRTRGVSPDKTDWRKSKTETAYVSLLLEYPLLKYQAEQLCPSGFLFACYTLAPGAGVECRKRTLPLIKFSSPSTKIPAVPLRKYHLPLIPLSLTQAYNIVPDDANEIRSLTTAPLTLPEYSMEVSLPC